MSVTTVARAGILTRRAEKIGFAQTIRHTGHFLTDTVHARNRTGGTTLFAVPCCKIARLTDALAGTATGAVTITGVACTPTGKNLLTRLVSQIGATTVGHAQGIALWTVIAVATIATAMCIRMIFGITLVAQETDPLLMRRATAAPTRTTIRIGRHGTQTGVVTVALFAILPRKNTACVITHTFAILQYRIVLARYQNIVDKRDNVFRTHRNQCHHRGRHQQTKTVDLERTHCM